MSVLAAALIAAPTLARSAVDDDVAMLRDLNLQTRTRVLQSLLSRPDQSLRPQLRRALLTALGDAEKSYVRHLTSLMGQHAATRRHTHRVEIEALRGRLWALLKQARTVDMLPLYEALRRYWQSPAETFRADPQLMRAEADIEWYSRHAVELGMPLPSPLQRLQDLQRRAQLEGIALAASDAQRAATQTALKLRRGLQPAEYEALMLTNEYRAMMGLNALGTRPSLIVCARRHSKEMRVNGFFSHRSPTPGRETLARRATLCEERVRAENIARRCATGAMAFRQWFGSAPHHRTMLDPGHRHLGVGQSGSYFTQWFAAD
jgi:uncharacterized protein YkwD